MEAILAVAAGDALARLLSEAWSKSPRSGEKRSRAILAPSLLQLRIFVACMIQQTGTHWPGTDASCRDYRSVRDAIAEANVPRFQSTFQEGAAIVFHGHLVRGLRSMNFSTD